MNNVIGTCSLCGGPVVVPSMMINPVALCSRCGAARKTSYGPVIPMEPPSPARRYVDSDDPSCGPGRMAPNTYSFRHR
jgi:hypothetical protein